MMLEYSINQRCIDAAIARAHLRIEAINETLLAAGHPILTQDEETKLVNESLNSLMSQATAPLTRKERKILHAPREDRPRGGRRRAKRFGGGECLQ